jgi:hypothetical protein
MNPTTLQDNTLKNMEHKKDPVKTESFDRGGEMPSASWRI